MAGRMEPEAGRPLSGKILRPIPVHPVNGSGSGGPRPARPPHLSRAKNHAASVAIQACGSQAATTGSTICLVASDEAKFVKR